MAIPRIYANDFGVVGDGVTDDRANMQKALDAASAYPGKVELYIHDGTYRLTRNTTTDYCLLVTGDGVKIRGESRTGVILKQAASIAASVRLLRIQGDDCTVDDLTLDGNKASQTVNEHRHGIIAVGAAGLKVTNVTAQNFTGDGFYLHLNTDRCVIRNCSGLSNDRNGITIGAQLTWLTVRDSIFQSNAFQQIDCEPGAGNIPQHIRIVNNVADCGSGNDYSIAMGGPSNTELTRYWTVRGNTVTGSIYCVWAADVDISYNTIVNPTTKSGVEVYRHCERVKVQHNNIRVTNASQVSLACVYVQGAGTGDGPVDVLVQDNWGSVVRADQFGARVEASISVTLRKNEFTGAASSSALNAGIYIRATNAAEDFEECVVEYNTVRNFGQYGISLQGNGAARLDRFVVNFNTVEDTSAVPTITTAIRLDDGLDVAREIECRRNTVGSNIATPVSWPSDVAVLTDYTAEGAEVFTTPFAPAGVIVAHEGAIAFRVSAGVVVQTYTKSSSIAATGWA